MEKFRKYQYVEVLGILSREYAQLNEVTFSCAVSAPNETASIFLQRVFSLGWLEDEYAEVTTGALLPNKKYLLVKEKYRAVADIYDAHVTVIRGKSTEHWYFYET